MQRRLPAGDADGRHGRGHRDDRPDVLALPEGQRGQLQRRGPVLPLRHDARRDRYGDLQHDGHPGIIDRVLGDGRGRPLDHPGHPPRHDVPWHRQPGHCGRLHLLVRSREGHRIGRSLQHRHRQDRVLGEDRRPPGQADVLGQVALLLLPLP